MTDMVGWPKLISPATSQFSEVQGGCGVGVGLSVGVDGGMAVTGWPAQAASIAPARAINNILSVLHMVFLQKK
jgi:hypothetical protein